MSVIHHNQVTVQLPSGWEDGTQVVALGPVDGGFRPNLVASQEPTKGSETSEQFAQRQLPALKQVLQGFSMVREGVMTLGPHRGFLREHLFNVRGSKLAQLQFYLVVGRTAYTFTYTHLANKLATTRKTAEQMIGAVVIR